MAFAGRLVFRRDTVQDVIFTSTGGKFLPNSEGVVHLQQSLHLSIYKYHLSTVSTH